MAVLLVAMSVMAVMMTVLMPAWKQLSRREKETEMAFRGEQYGRAIALYGRKYANALPPNIEVLVREHFLRKEFKDPITNDAFDVIRMGQSAAGAPAGGPQRGGAAQPQRSPASGTQRGGGPGFGTTGPAGPGQGPGVGGIYGVMSKSKEQSIRIYKGRTHYNEWVFTAPPQAAAQGPGGTGAPGVGGIPGVGGPGTGGRGPGSGGRGALPPGGGFPPSGPDGSRGRGPGFPGGGRGPGGNPFPFPTPPRGRGPGG